MFALGAFLLFWALNIFFLAADYIINQHAPFFLVLRFVVFRIPQATPMAFPFACLFAALLAMGRVMGDNEVTAMRTAGIPVMRIVLSPFVFGLAMFALSLRHQRMHRAAFGRSLHSHFLSDHLPYRRVARRAAILSQGSRYGQHVLRYASRAR